MNIQVLLTILTIGELAIITSALAAFLFFRQRKLRRVAKNAITKAKKKANPDGSTPEQYLQTSIDATNEALKSASSENVTQLNLRIAFLQSELITCSDDSGPKEYWDGLCHRISEIVPISGEDTSDLDQSSGENELPPSSNDKPSQEITKLRNIISKQHNSVGELKQSILDNEEEIGQLSGLLKQIENIEVAQAQLNMSIDGVEKLNLKLRQQAEEISNSSIEQEPTTDLEALPDLELNALPDIELEDSETHDNNENETDSGFNNQVLIANEKIERLESEAQEKDVLIENLEQEVSRLEAEIQEQQAALLIANQQQSSNTNDFMQSSDDPEVLTHQIEDLTDLLVQKSEELADLQYGKQELIDTISDAIDDTIDDAVSDDPIDEIEISTADMDMENDVHQSIDQFLDEEADNYGVPDDVDAIPDINLDDDMIIPDIDDIVFPLSHDDSDQSHEDPYFDLGVIDNMEDPSIPTIGSTVSGDALRGILDGVDEVENDDSDISPIANTK